MDQRCKVCGIVICGPNGSGKSTLGRALAGALGYRLMDAEDYYFPDPQSAYSMSRTREEVRTLLLEDMNRYGQFVLVSVNGDWGEEINARCGLVVWLDAPLELRLERVKQRTLDRFGERALPGGDLYEQEEAFHAFAAARSVERIERWLDTVSCPVLRLDGTREIAANAALITAHLKEQGLLR